MEEANISSSVNVIVQLDPNQQSSDPQARRYKIHHNNNPEITSPVIEYLGEIDSGDYRSLADFVNWGVRKYPANRFALVIWSHGNGWTRENEDTSRWICSDSHSMSQIGVADGDFKRAFQLFPHKLDILIMDACFMQTIEVITEVYQFNDYIIASGNSVPYEGFPYKDVLELWNTSSSPYVLSQFIVEEYIASYLPGGSQNPYDSEFRIMCSAVHTNQYSSLLTLIKEFSQKWQHIASQDFVRTARENSYAFNYPQSDVDIRDFFTNLSEQTDDQELKKDVNRILDSLNSIFIAELSLNLPPNTGTATIWFPVHDYNYTGSIDLYSELDFAQTDWTLFLKSFLEIESQ